MKRVIVLLLLLLVLTVVVAGQPQPGKLVVTEVKCKGFTTARNKDFIMVHATGKLTNEGHLRYSAVTIECDILCGGSVAAKFSVTCKNIYPGDIVEWKTERGLPIQRDYWKDGYCTARVTKVRPVEART